MQTDYGSSALSQQLVTHWLRSGLYETHVTALKSALHERAKFLHALLVQHFSAIATWQQPAGGFYIWLRLSKPVVTKSLFLKLLQHNVLINPGYVYMLNDFHHIRLSFSYASPEDMKYGVEKLAAVIFEAYNE